MKSMAPWSTKETINPKIPRNTDEQLILGQKKPISMKNYVEMDTPDPDYVLYSRLCESNNLYTRTNIRWRSPDGRMVICVRFDTEEGSIIFFSSLPIP